MNFKRMRAISNPMNFIMQMMMGGQSPQQITQSLVAQNPQLQVLLNQAQQSGMSMQQYAMQYARQNNINIKLDEKILELQSTKPTDAQITAEEEKLRILEKQREEAFKNSTETQKMYKSIRDMGLDPLHGNGWKLIETEKMNAIYAAKAGMGDYINDEGTNITKVIEEENAYRDLDVEISKTYSTLGDMRRISEDINNLSAERVGKQEQLNKWLKVEEDLS